MGGSRRARSSGVRHTHTPEHRSVALSGRAVAPANFSVPLQVNGDTKSLVARARCQQSPIMARLLLVAALFAVAAGFQSPVSQMPRSRVAASRVAPAAITMEEPSDKAVVIGAAAVGGVVGVYLFHELSTGVLLACIAAYGATLSNGFGEAAKSTGAAASKVYSKTLELNEQYDVLPKAKSALDTVTTATSNLDKNYGITAKIDEQLKITAAMEKVTDKVDEVKTSVTEKVSDLKAKADSAP